MYELLKSDGEAVCLIKPQFEAGRENVGKKGVVRDPAVHESVITTIAEFANSQKFDVLGLEHSPVKGPEGNIEYLMYIKKCSSEQSSAQVIATAGELVKRSHEVLDK